MCISPQKICRIFVRGVTVFMLGLPHLSLYAAEPSSPTEVLAPACKSPAPLKGKWDPQAPGYFAVYKDGLANLEKATAAIAQKHGFTIANDLSLVGMFFVKELTPQQLAKLRCEPQIAFIEYNAGVSISGK